VLTLVNQTPVPANLHLARVRKFQRVGILVAKATFRFEDGKTVLDTQDPHAILTDDLETELGFLPEDLRPPREPGCEVIVLGMAHAPGDEPVSETIVKVRVGSTEQRLRVVGDRKWVKGAHGFQATKPAPFRSMPLVWERAFGGRCDVWVDAEAVVEITHELNARGRGFDPRPAAQALCQTLRAPEGFPVLDDPMDLPNLEHPEHPVLRRDDTPAPWCWATIPGDIGMRAAISMQRLKANEPAPDADPVEEIAMRAHPTWRLEPLAAASRVSLHGLTPSGTETFTIPRIKVVADYVLGGPERSGTIGCHPYRLIVLPEEQRFTLSFCAHFTIDPVCWEDTSMRLRLEEGWHE
jgi:hypothetical protein